MATENISSWETEISIDVQGYSFPAMQKAVRDAAITFCEKTHLWTDDLDRITVVANTPNYALSMPAAIPHGEIIGIDDVKYKQDGMDDDQFVTLDPISENQMDLHDSGSWKWRTSSTPAKYYADKTHAILYLKNTPTLGSADGLLVRAILRPTKDATVLEDFLYNHHYKAIADGAKGYLLSQSAQPWFNAQFAAMFGGTFTTAISEAKGQKIDRGTKRKMSVRMREWV